LYSLKKSCETAKVSSCKRELAEKSKAKYKATKWRKRFSMFLSPAIAGFVNFSEVSFGLRRSAAGLLKQQHCFLRRIRE
jgi:hypothetical protein